MYKYEENNKFLFTDKGQREFMKVRDSAFRLLAKSGAFTTLAPFEGSGANLSDSWQMLACIDRMVEIGDIREVTDRSKVSAQDRVFVKA
jgi:hypothetical protein